MRALATQTNLEALSKVSLPQRTNNVTEASSWGIERKHDPDHNGQLRWVCSCACGKTSSMGEPPDINPQALTNRMRNRGWLISQKRPPICPTCAQENHVMSKNPVGPDPKIARRVYGLLDDHFNEEARVYRPGWNDKKIAEAADTSFDLVVDIRRKAYGELAEDPVIQIIRDDIELIRMEMQDLTVKFNTDMAALHERLTQTERKLPSHVAKAA